MDGIRREVVEFSMWAGVLLHGNGMKAPLNDEEVKLLETYITRISEKLKCSRRPLDANAPQQPKGVNGKEPYRRMAV